MSVTMIVLLAVVYVIGWVVTAGFFVASTEPGVTGMEYLVMCGIIGMFWPAFVVVAIPGAVAWVGFEMIKRVRRQNGREQSK